MDEWIDGRDTKTSHSASVNLTMNVITGPMSQYLSPTVRCLSLTRCCICLMPPEAYCSRDIQVKPANKLTQGEKHKH